MTKSQPIHVPYSQYATKIDACLAGLDGLAPGVQTIIQNIATEKPPTLSPRQQQMITDAASRAQAYTREMAGRNAKARVG